MTTESDTPMDAALTNECILRYAAEAERNATMLVVEGAACIDEFGSDSGCRSRLAIAARKVLQNREAEADGVRAETKRCAKIASDFTMSPVVGKAIAALIMEGR